MHRLTVRDRSDPSAAAVQLTAYILAAPEARFFPRPEILAVWSASRECPSSRWIDMVDDNLARPLHAGYGQGAEVVALAVRSRRTTDDWLIPNAAATLRVLPCTCIASSSKSLSNLAKRSLKLPGGSGAAS